MTYNIFQIVGFIGLITSIVVTILIILAVVINFIESKFHSRAHTIKKSIVETGSMFLFYFFYVSLIKFRIGAILFEPTIHLIMIIIGTILLIIGCITNITGRMNLGDNWANQIKIYKDHSLILTGPYRFVRHPLYASLIWMFYGGSFVYSNYLSFIANTLIFIPFMYYRAKQEENMLLKKFNNYKKYQKDVGMFFPKFIRG